MLRNAVDKAMWVRRATVFFVGLVVILALLLGAASMAFAKNGDPWLLGRTNVATAITKLGGAAGVNGPMLQLVNNNAGANDTALDLRVQSGEAPMRVNRATKVTNLNADKLDGRDSRGFMPSKTYSLVESRTAPANTQEWVAEIFCDVGDLAINGGFANVDSTSHVETSVPSFESGWLLVIKTGSTSDTYNIQMVCADLPPLRP